MKETGKLEKFSKNLVSAMTDAILARNLIRDAFPTTRWGNAKASCWQAYRRLKLSSERRARAIWNGETARIDAWEMDALRNEALKQARVEHARTKDRIAALETLLRIQDADFHSLEIGALRGVAGGEDSTVDRE